MLQNIVPLGNDTPVPATASPYAAPYIPQPGYPQPGGQYPLYPSYKPYPIPPSSCYDMWFSCQQSYCSGYPQYCSQTCGYC
ncbi:unnamed protein product [Bursaphelenchus okinawaensis]|uniref:ShKT domain-containing protein n=1 Tax=Bursaphelenchus okinawaensis TaxID=465554 RepID=A0A811K8V0_9BILA|nr:unnamed protein product [Bursaphelenchus okinawaensis]CAG9094448.1 unnamed protein product [Bursaphelenchus okinawaensis]